MLFALGPILALGFLAGALPSADAAAGTTGATPASGSNGAAAATTWARAEALQRRGQYAEASQLYETIAGQVSDPADRVLALLFAADSALDADQLARARALVNSARISPGSDDVRDLVAVLEAQLLALERDRPTDRFPSVPEPAARDADRSSSLGVPSLARSVAPRTSRGWEGFLVTSVGGGYDSNVSLAAASVAGADATTQAPEGDWFSTALVMANVGRSWNRRSTSELTYEFLQVAYLQPAHDANALQDHTATLTQRLRLSRRATVAFDGYVEATFRGLRQGLTPFQRVVGLNVAAIIDESSAARLRCGGGLLGRDVSDPDYRQLTGTRLEGSLQQDLRAGGWLFSVRGAYRRDGVGEVSESLGTTPAQLPGLPCTGCPLAALTPYSNRTLLIETSIRSPVDARFRVSGRLKMEDRLYDPARLEATGTDTLPLGFEYRQRHDRRWVAGAEARLGQDFAIALRYDLTLNTSQLLGEESELCRVNQLCNPLQQHDYNYFRQMLSLDVDYDVWFR